MKKILLTLILWVTMSVTYAQTQNFECYKAETSYWSKTQQEWIVRNTYVDLDYRIAVTSNRIFINAKTPSFIDVDPTSSKEVDGNGKFWGYQYTGTWYTKNSRDVLVFMVAVKDAGVQMVVTYDSDGELYNIKYYMKSL